MFQSDKPDNKMSSILGPELEIKGDVRVTGSLLIYGKVFGDIESQGTVRTAKGSQVKGNIKAKDAAISGKVEGDVNVDSKVISCALIAPNFCKNLPSPGPHGGKWSKYGNFDVF